MSLRRIANNPLTGNPRIGGACTLLSVSEVASEFNNDKKTKYHRATVEIETKPGVMVKRQAIMYAKAYNKGGFKVGDSLLLTAETTPNQQEPLLVVSNLHTADRASATDFASIFDQAEPEATAATPATPVANTIRETVGEDA